MQIVLLLVLIDGIYGLTTSYSCPVCVTPACISTANTILQNMDVSADPCDNFYEFACGNFVKKKIIPEDKAGVGSYSIMRDNLQQQLYMLFREPISNRDPDTHILVKMFYKQCMDMDEIEKQGIRPLITKLKCLGKWPVLVGPKWSVKTDMVHLLNKLKHLGYSTSQLLRTHITIDHKNSTKRILGFDHGIMGLSNEYLRKGHSNKIVTAYFNYMVNVAEYLGARRETAEADFKEVLDLQIRLAKKSLKKEMRRNPALLYNIYTIAELQLLHENIPFLDIIKASLFVDKFNIDESENVVVVDKGYLTALNEEIPKINKRVLWNLMLWTVVSNSVTYLTEPLRNLQLQYAASRTGISSRHPRWQECLSHVHDGFPLITGSMFVRQYFDRASKKEAQEMVENIRSIMHDIISKSEWMDADTQQAALAKLSKITPYIGYPEELLNDELLHEHHRNSSIKSSFLGSSLDNSVESKKYYHSMFRLPVNKSEWQYHGRSAIVNAFYNRVENSIEFPAGVLQGLFFSQNRPKYVNYGIIGYTIGHEITHGFDDKGRQYDGQGNLRDWWTRETKSAFLEKAQCIIDLYNSYSIPGSNLTVNGVYTQGENIADNGGMKIAYYAYKAWAKGRVLEASLPGLKFSPKQMFWISAANKWCYVYKPQSLENKLLTDTHSPGIFRVNGPMSNMKEFAEDFNCPEGSRMNPKHKCSVW